MNKRPHHRPEFKTKVALKVLAEEQTVNQIAAKHPNNPVVIARWKKKILELATEIFKKNPSEAEKTLSVSQEHIADLERKVGQLTYEVDWMKNTYSNPRARLGEKPLI